MQQTIEDYLHHIYLYYRKIIPDKSVRASAQKIFSRSCVISIIHMVESLITYAKILLLPRIDILNQTAWSLIGYLHHWTTSSLTLSTFSEILFDLHQSCYSVLWKMTNCLHIEFYYKLSHFVTHHHSKAIASLSKMSKRIFH